MGGKTLRFPKRKKFVPSNDNVVEEKEEKEITPEEHDKRLQALRDAGLIK